MILYIIENERDSPTKTYTRFAIRIKKLLVYDSKNKIRGKNFVLKKCKILENFWQNIGIISFLKDANFC